MSIPNSKMACPRACGYTRDRYDLWYPLPQPQLKLPHQAQ